MEWARVVTLAWVGAVLLTVLGALETGMQVRWIAGSGGPGRWGAYYWANVACGLGWLAATAAGLGIARGLQRDNRAGSRSLLLGGCGVLTVIGSHLAGSVWAWLTVQGLPSAPIATSAIVIESAHDLVVPATLLALVAVVWVRARREPRSACEAE